MSKKGIELVLVFPTVIILAAIVFFPMMFSLVVSVINYDLRIPEHSFAGLKNFIEVLKDVTFHKASIVTGTMLFVELVIELLLGLLLALILEEFPRSRKMYQPILLIPMMIMPVVVRLRKCSVSLRMTVLLRNAMGK
jgi:ABC-type sugar transport system permease subunit